MSNRTFNILRFVQSVLLPALATLYLAVAQIWGLPYQEQIPATLTALVAFLGAFVEYRRQAWKEAQDEEVQSD